MPVPQDANLSKHLIVALYAKFSLPGNSKIWINIQIFQLSGEERLFCEALRKPKAKASLRLETKFIRAGLAGWSKGYGPAGMFDKICWADTAWHL
jgi:hypothetical protein